ncbi:MAG: hypothetical protein HY712_03495 [candidate division NC10 bacterium]|nr:hypothetical protein [candidate division NC10 bacterium]
MRRGDATIRIPSLWALVGVLCTLVAIGLVVFLQRYRGADRTAMAFGSLVGAGLCLILALTRFQVRFAGRPMTRRSLRWRGVKSGSVAGGCTIGVTICLLALRWGMDQSAGPTGGEFLPAFLRALSALAVEMLWGVPLYLGIGAVVGVLAGFGVAEAIAASAREVSAPTPPEGG